MKRKWHKLEDVLECELLKETGFHVWSLEVGMHACIYDIVSGFRSLHNDKICYGFSQIELIMPFPQLPRRRNM